MCSQPHVSRNHVRPRLGRLNCGVCWRGLASLEWRSHWDDLVLHLHDLLTGRLDGDAETELSGVLC